MSNLTLPAFLVEQAVPQELTLGNFADKYKQEITAVIKQLRAFCGQAIDLEGGHIYSDESISEHYVGQLRKTALLKDILMNSGHGFDVETTLFVDNYHPTEHTLSIPSYLKMAAMQGLNFDHVFFEAAMVPQAEKHIQTLQAAGATKMHNDNLALKTGEHLIKADGSLSCGVLDATLSKTKLARVAAGVIVLPDEYKAQQRNMRAILKALFAAEKQPESGPICSFFTKP